MKLRHGKLLTPAREQLVRDYLRRRDVNQWRRTNCGGIEYGDWVRGFERFMCRGLEDVVRVESDRPVADAAQDIQHDHLADAGGPNVTTAQVD